MQMKKIPFAIND